MAVIYDDRYNDICEKVKKRERYERMTGVYAFGSLLCLITPLLVSIPILVQLNIQISNYWTLPLVGLGVLLAIGVLQLSKRRKTYHVDDSEWAIYYTRPLYINLDKCVKEKKSEEMKEDYRKEALTYAKDLLTCIEERWIEAPLSQ